MPLETAIHKMTGATAKALKLKDRGLLREGFRADVAIFDPADFRDRATYADPHQYPTGARTSVIVNGNWWWRTPRTPARCRDRCCEGTRRRGGMMAADCTLRPQSSPDRGSGQ